MAAFNTSSDRIGPVERDPTCQRVKGGSAGLVSQEALRSRLPQVWGLFGGDRLTFRLLVSAHFIWFWSSNFLRLCLEEVLSCETVTCLFLPRLRSETGMCLCLHAFYRHKSPSYRGSGEGRRTWRRTWWGASRCWSTPWSRRGEAALWLVEKLVLKPTTDTF